MTSASVWASLSASTRSATSSVIDASSSLRCFGRQLAGVDDAVEQDLDVDLVVAAVDAGRVVDGVGVDEPAGEGVLDPPELGEPEVAALADHAAAQVAAVDAHAVVGAVADVGVGLAASP